MELKINQELKALIPPLTGDEYRLLEESIIDEGCRDKIITWDDTIVDGHNRYEICTNHGVPFQTEDRDFESMDAVKVWMIDNQKGRRNLTDGWKWELAQARKAILAEKHKQERKERYVSNVDTHPAEKQSESGRTQKEIASELGWSTGKVAMADKVWKQAKPEIKEKIKTGEVSFNQAYTDIKKEEKKEHLRNKKVQYENKIANKQNSNNSIDIYSTKNKYRIIYADPPWSYNDKQETPNLGGANKHYNTMTTTNICMLPVLSFCEPNAVLFLWVTSPLLEDGLRVIKEWGFKYKSSFIWDKVNHNMGHYNSVRHEFLLIATRGSCVPDNKTLYDSVQSIQKTEKHSQKPQEFIDIINELYTHGNRIELFARENNDPKWDYWGNEI